MRKTSLPNFEASEDREPLMFNSQVQLPQVSSLTSQKFESLLGIPGDVPHPSMDLVQSIARSIGEVANLSLFGFDIIRDNSTGKYAVIDLNFFPSYRGVEGLHEALLALISTKLSKK